MDNLKNHVNVFSWTSSKESFTIRITIYSSATQWTDISTSVSPKLGGKEDSLSQHLFNLSCLPQDDD